MFRRYTDDLYQMLHFGSKGLNSKCVSLKKKILNVYLLFLIIILFLISCVDFYTITVEAVANSSMVL